MIHAEQPIMDVEPRIDIDTETDLTPIVEEYVFPESPNQVQRELVQDTVEPIIIDIVEPIIIDTVEPVLIDTVEPILTNQKPINRHRKPWSVSEIARLYSEYQIKRYTVDEIAEMHGRTYFAIVAKLKSENILYNVSDEEDEYLEEVMGEYSEESEASDEECSNYEDGVEIKYPGAFLQLALAYCYAVETVVDFVFAGARHVYRTFVPTATQNKKIRR